MSARQRALAYLSSHNVVSLATAGPEGPWAAAVFYVNDGMTLYFLSSPRSRHSRNIEARPQVAATIQEDYGDWSEIRGIQLEGEARRLEAGERGEAIDRYAAKFPVISDPEQGEIQSAMSKIEWYRLDPRRVFFIDNSAGFGQRDEVPIEEEVTA